MSLRHIRLYAVLLPLLILLGSCSTTRVLSDNQTRLKSNVITIVNKNGQCVKYFVFPRRNKGPFCLLSKNICPQGAKTVDKRFAIL